MKSFTSYITEAFNKPYKWKQTSKRRDTKRWSAEFTTTDSKLKYEFNSIDLYGEEDWDVSFHLKTGPKYNDTNMGITGTAGADAFRILATVRAMFMEFVSQNDPNHIEFVAEKYGDSPTGKARSPIYTRFAKEFAKTNDYDLKINDASHQTAYHFWRKK
jgi:hypothetical protein